MNIRRTIAQTLLIILTGVLIIELPAAIASRVDGNRWFDPIADVHGHIMDDFVKNANRQAMQQAVIAAMIESLDDQYSQYIPPSLESDFTKELSGDYAGIGARIENRGRAYKTKPLKIMTPMRGSPSLAAGVRPGDEVLEIDGWPTVGELEDDCIDRLLGTPGTEVKVLLRHEDGEEEEVTIIRGRIRTSNIHGLITTEDDWQYHLGDDGIIYVRIDQFTDRTVDELESTLKKANAQQPLTGLILDLRDNPGGSLEAAVDMVDLFLDSGEIVSIRSPRDDKQEVGEVYETRKSSPWESLPLVVMINSRSASASEIVSGALSDHGRAKVIGERSFGKGSVQELRPLEGGNGLLKMTTKYYFLPNGRHLQKAKYASKEPWGVDPSEGCVVPESNEENSERIRARLPFVDIGGEYEQLPEIVDDEWVVDNLKDNALGEAIDLLRKRNELDTWPELPEDDDPMFDSMAVGLDTLMKRRDLYEKAMAEVQDEINQFEGMALESKLGLGLPEETVLEEPVIAIYDAEGNLIGKWQVDGNDDLDLMLSTTKLVRIEDDSDDMQDE